MSTPIIKIETITIDREPFEISQKTADLIDQLKPVIIEVCPTCGAEANAACRGCED